LHPGVKFLGLHLTHIRKAEVFHLQQQNFAFCIENKAKKKQLLKFVNFNEKSM